MKNGINRLRACLKLIGPTKDIADQHKVLNILIWELMKIHTEMKKMDEMIKKVRKDIEQNKKSKAKKDVKKLLKMDKKQDAKIAKCDKKPMKKAR